MDSFADLDRQSTAPNRHERRRAKALAGHPKRKTCGCGSHAYHHSTDERSGKPD
jgi:hypothetical protein